FVARIDATTPARAVVGPRDHVDRGQAPHCIRLRGLRIAAQVACIALAAKSRGATLAFERLYERQGLVAVENQDGTAQVGFESHAEPPAERFRVDAPSFGRVVKLARLQRTPRVHDLYR